MAIVEFSAQLTGTAETSGRAGLRMGLEATIRRPKPSDHFGPPTPLPEETKSVSDAVSAPEGGV